jgi:predicted permease
MGSLPRRLLRALKNLLGRRRLERDLTDEVGGYEEMLVREHVAAGLSPDAARRKARLHMGSPDDVKESVRDVRAGALVEQLAWDTRFALRTLARSPGFTTFTVLTFAVAIGGLTVIFSLVNAVLVRPLPYPQSDRLVMVLETDSRSTTGGSTVAAPNFFDWKGQSASFERMALYEYQGYNLAEGGKPEQVGGLRVTGGVFDLLGVTPLLGRGLLPSDDEPGAAPVVVLSHQLWRQRFGGDSSLVGKTIRVNKRPFQVVGIMPRGFAFPSNWQQLWVPVGLNEEDRGRGSHSFFAIARVKDGVTLAGARAEMRSIGDRLAVEYPATNTGETVSVFPMKELWVQDTRKTLQALLAAVGLVVLIASANVASLVVARNATRRREIAARMALGGTRSRIVRQLVTESVVLALGGALLGLGLAVFGIRGLVALLPPGLRNVPFRDLSSVSLDLTVFLVVGGVAVVAGVVAGLVPALTTLPDEPAEVLREAGARHSTARRSRTLKSVLVGVEVALAVIVLVGAGLLLGSIRRLQRVAPGLDPARVVAVSMVLPQDDFYGPAERRSYCEDLTREVGGIAGVEAVGAVSHVPLTGANAGRSFVLEGASDPGPEHLPSASYGVSCPGYFQAMGIPLTAGRDFSPVDRPGAPPVVIVNSRFAERWLPGGSAVGRRFKLGRFDSQGPWLTIVGVVGDVHHKGLDQRPEAYFYAPYQQAAWPNMTVMVRSAGSQVPLGLIKEALGRAAPGEPIGDGQTMAEVLEGSLGHLRFPVVLFSIFAVVALALAALGTFGVASQAVVQRRREMGIRIALGAGASQVTRMVVRQSLVPVAWGVLVGLGASVGVTRVLSGLLFEIRPTDPLTMGLGALVLSITTLLACLVPARRASRTDPVVVLREE